MTVTVEIICLSQGELAISCEMEKLQSALFFDNVPDTWTRLAYPSTYSLAIWCVCVFRPNSVNKGTKQAFLTAQVRAVLFQHIGQGS